MLDYLKKNSVIDYSLTKIKTIDNNRIKQIAYINNNNLLLCFEETTDSLLTLNVYNPLNDFNLETSFTFKEKVEHILQYYDTNIIYLFCTEGVLSIYSIDIHSIQLIKSKTLNNFELTSITLISNNRIAGYFRDALTVEIWNFDSLTRLEKLNKENIEFIDDLNYYRYDDSVTKILEYKEELIVLYHKGFSHDSFDSEFEFEMLNNYYLCIWSLKIYQLITSIPKFSTDNKIYLINDSIISYYLLHFTFKRL